MQEHIEDPKTVFNEITDPNYSDTLWAKIYKNNTLYFSAKVRGLKSRIYFENMPWSYTNSAYWRIVAPYIHKKTYAARLLEANAETLKLEVTVKDHAHTAKNYTRGQSYNCIVLDKFAKHILVDTGFDSNFRNGSQYGNVFLYDFWQKKDFNSVAIGDILPLTYLKHDKNSKLVMCDPQKYKMWYKQKPQAMVGKLAPVTAVRYNGNVSLKLYDLFDGILRISPKMYPPHLVDKLTHYKQSLEDGQVIQCMVQGLNPKTNQAFLRFDPSFLEEMERNVANSLN
jgi:hypothetical protein